MKWKYDNGNHSGLEDRNIKSKIVNRLDLPKEIILDLPIITMTGNEEVAIENYKSLIEYSEGHIRINTSCGVLKIEGKKLILKVITTEYALVKGNIINIHYAL